MCICMDTCASQYRVWVLQIAVLVLGVYSIQSTHSSCAVMIFTTEQGKPSKSHNIFNVHIILIWDHLRLCRLLFLNLTIVEFWMLDHFIFTFPKILKKVHIYA
jgi:hypothetical protein